MGVGANIKEIREQKGMTQSELAKAVDVRQSMISMIERGTKTVSVQLCIAIANVLQIDISEILKK